MTNFAIQVYLQYKGLFVFLDAPAYISNVFLRPGLVLLAFGLVGRFANSSNTQDYIIGMIAVSISAILMTCILYSFYHEWASGTLTVLFGSPGSRLAIYWSKGLLHYPNSLLTAAASLLFARFIVDLDLSKGEWLSMACSVLLMGASCTAFALFVGNFAIVLRGFQNLIYATSGLFLTLTGVIIPTARLPGVLSEISQFLPLTNGLVALRASFRGAGMAAVGHDLLLELAVGLSYVIVGFLVFRLIEARARRTGS